MKVNIKELGMVVLVAIVSGILLSIINFENRIEKLEEKTKHFRCLEKRISEKQKKVFPDSAAVGNVMVIGYYSDGTEQMKPIKGAIDDRTYNFWKKSQVKADTFRTKWRKEYRWLSTDTMQGLPPLKAWVEYESEMQEIQ